MCRASCRPGRAQPWYELGLLAVVVFCLSPELRAAQPLSTPGPHAKQLVAVRSEAPPEIDGYLTDPAWEAAIPISDFVQHEPIEGQPPTEKTEVRLLYDSTHLYIAVRCFDEEPSRILVSETGRDSELTETDAFWMVLDTFHDRRSAFVFGTNPSGIEFDGQVTNDGGSGGVAGASATRGRTTQQGSGADFNKNWDGAWTVRARIDERGWTAEFAIPLTTLRFPGSGPQVWGVNFARNIRRKNEQVYWSSVPRHWNLYRVSLAGEMHGLDLKQPRNLKITPYALGSARRDFAVHTEARRAGDWGGDVKYSITPNLTLDLTYNTDFAQVEVDEQQVNLTRFNLFFPEKRPFFLENAGFFALGTSSQVEMFFSRRIGLDRDGEVIPIVGGARLSGSAGSWNLGVLNMQTDGGSVGTNFLVTRVNRQLGRRSNIGGLFINKQATGLLGSAERYNRSMALDGRLGFGDALMFSGFVARTSTMDGDAGTESAMRPLEGAAYNVATSYRRRTHGFSLAYTEVGEGFNPEVGFLERRAFRKINGGVNSYVRVPSVDWLRQLGPHVSWRRYTALDGFLESEVIHLDSHVDWENGTHFSPAIDIIYEGVRVPFELFPGVIVPPGAYRHPVVAWRFNSNLSAPVSVQLAVDAGGFYSGRLGSYRAGLNWRYSNRIGISGTWTRNDARLPIAGPNQEFGGTFKGDLISVRANYSFSPRVYLQSLLQYNEAADNWSINVRFGWLNTAGTGLFAVYNETQDLEGLDLASRVNIRRGGPLNRAFILKFTREFQIFQ